MAVAIATHIPMADWLAAGDEAIATAIELLDEQRRAVDDAR